MLQVPDACLGGLQSRSGMEMKNSDNELKYPP